MDGHLIKNIVLGTCLILFVVGFSVVLIIVGVKLNIEDLMVLGIMFLAMIIVILVVLIIGGSIRDANDTNDDKLEDKCYIKDNEMLFNVPEKEDYDNKAFETKEQVVISSVDTMHQYHAKRVAIETEHSDGQSSERYKSSRSSETQYTGLSSAANRYKTDRNFDAVSRTSIATYKTLDDTTIHIPIF